MPIDSRSLHFARESGRFAELRKPPQFLMYQSQREYEFTNNLRLITYCRDFFGDRAEASKESFITMKRIAILVSLVGCVAAANAVAFDNAADSAYSSGWANGSGGGVGLGAWSLSASTSNPSNAGFFIGSSLGNAGGGAGSAPGVDTSSKAWAMYANSGNSTNAARSFGALGAGGSFKLGMDNGWIDNNGEVGYSLTGTGGSIEFGFRGGSPNYYFKINGGPAIDTGIGFTGGGLNTIVSVGASTVTFTANRLGSGGGASTYTTTFGMTGNFFVVNLFNRNAGPNSERNAYFNNIETVVPEPATMAALGLGLAAVARRRKSK